MTIFEIKIKDYAIKIDDDSCFLVHNDDVLLKISRTQIKSLAKWIICKINELKDSSEVKKLDK